ncbi:MAG TPA: phospho-N-acetylmuramoyl-pentapeptide-transferase [Longimicrobiales bacterium]|nr:phospho-N-acetylmuramoyl-pentapeptide-transferase [Longimicrobiales bacterium]
MLYHLLYPLADQYSFLNLFRYITFRAAGGMATAIMIAFLFGPPIIRWLQRLRFGQVVRQEGPQSHLAKAGTPTMGGVLIIVATLIGTLLWADLTNEYVLIAMAVMVWLGALGFLDDYLKVVRRRTEGLVGKYKLIGQGMIGIIVGIVLLIWPASDIPTHWTSVPFFADYHVAFILPVLFIPWVMLVLAGSSNAVNLTDGLDGLAGGLSAIAAATFGVFAYVIGRVDTSNYLGLFYMAGAGELSIFCVALAGATLGFLWFNAHPAEVFMGDTGSLALGGALGAVAVLIKGEFLLVIVGGVFVVEAISVMAQVGWFKYTARTQGRGQRLLAMAPLHHHFEKQGWAESKIIMRFWILGILCSLVAFSTLKIR